MAASDPAPRQTGGRIKDARGHRVTQLDPVALYLLRQHAVIEADALQAIANEKGVRITAGERAALLGGLCGALLVISLFTHALITGDIRDAPSAKTASLLWLCSILWIIWYAIKRKRFGAIVAAMLKHLHCPHCGYDLRLLPVNPADGATVCPECGCAWGLAAGDADRSRAEGNSAPGGSRGKRAANQVKVPWCHRCPLHKHAERRPKSLIARLWRWHTTWCPGWKAYQKWLAAQSPPPIPRA